MFCDLAGSTEMSNRLDPEDLRDVVRQYQRCCEEAVRAQDGHVAQLLGDGVLVYFGYPTHHEDDSRRAVAAGLDILERVSRLSEQLRGKTGTDLAVRVGIHTGLAVVGGMGGEQHTEKLALGSAPNLAARIQGAAQLNTVLISEATRQLVSGYFVLDEGRTVELKGFTEPVTLHEVHASTGAKTRLQAAARTSMTPLTGRAKEENTLTSLWESAAKGQTCSLVLSGEAGIGKSRLVHQLLTSSASTPHRRLEAQCSPDAVNSAWRPVAELIERQLSADSDDAKVEKLAEWCTRSGLDAQEAVPLVASVLSLPVDAAAYPMPAVGPLKLREKTQIALAQLLLPVEGATPNLLVVEDLHWADASTLELLGILLSRERPGGSLLVMTHRPEFTPTLPTPESRQDLALARLDAGEQRAMAELIAGKRLPDPIVELVVEKADGVPLFVEEVTKAILDAGILEEADEAFVLARDEVPKDLLPPTIQGLLASRLDATGDAKQIAQLASVIGREFSLPLLAAVSPWDEKTLRDLVDQLLDAALVVKEESAQTPTFVFRHALIRDAAYDSLLKSSRKAYHGQLGDALTARFPAISAARPDLVARHYSLAGAVDQALPKWVEAASKALASSSYVDARAHLEAGLGEIEHMPESPSRRQAELDVRGMLGMALIPTVGYGGEGVEENFGRAEHLTRELGEADSHEELIKRFAVAWGFWVFHQVRLDLDLAREKVAQMRATSGETHLAIECDVSGAQVDFWSGDALEESRRGFMRAVDNYDRETHGVNAFIFNQDPKAVALANMPWVTAILGDPETALEELQAGIDHARAIAHPYSEAVVLAYGAQLQYFLQDEPACRELADRAIALSEEHGFPTWLATGAMYRGWSRAHRGEHEISVPEIQGSLGIWTWLGVLLNGPMRSALLAQAQLHAGDRAAALATIDDAIARTEESQEKYYEAELHRLRGTFLLQTGADRRTEAVDELRRALTVAKTQRAKLWEVSAAAELAPLLHEDGHVDEARSILEGALEGTRAGSTAAAFVAARERLAELA